MSSTSSVGMSHPSVSKLAASVKFIRDILRKHGITDMDSLQHCMLVAGVRMLEGKICIKLKLSPAHCWENLKKALDEKDETKAMEILQTMFNALDSKFETKEFKWSLDNRDDTIKILKSIADVDILEASKHTDVLGYIYENHVNTGAGKGGGRDLGKFYTDRSMTRYLAELLGASVINGKPPSMCDATMGTGGFILSHIENVLKQCPNPVWDDFSIAGGDIDDKVAAICKLNLFLKTGRLFPLIRRRNTLKEDIADEKERREYDIVLMNIPFGVKGLVLAHDCCERVRDIVKSGTKSEPLFMALVCQLVAEGGKAAVIVPDGVLTNKSKQHDAMRKYLLDNFEVRRIIKMRGKFFMNTGIQPSVIVFERTGQSTKTVEFWDVEKKEGGEIVETRIASVGREQMDASCSFDARRWTAAAADAKASAGGGGGSGGADGTEGARAGYPTVSLEEILDSKNGQILSMESINNNRGDYPIMSGGREYCGVYSMYNRSSGCISVSKTGSSSGFVKYHQQKFWAADCFTLEAKDPSACNLKFVYYCLMLRQDEIWKLYKRDGVMPHCYWSDFQTIRLPLPPIEIQREIVGSMDRIFCPGISEIETSLVAAEGLLSPGTDGDSVKSQARAFVSSAICMLGASNKFLFADDTWTQMKDVMKAICRRGWETEELGQLLTDHSVKKAVAMSSAVKGEFPLFSSSAEMSYHNEAEFSGMPYLVQGSRGTISKATHYCELPFSVSNNTFVLSSTDTSKMLLKFAYYWLKLSGVADDIATTSVIPMLTKTMFRAIRMPVPPLDIQADCVERLDKLEKRFVMLHKMEKEQIENARLILQSYL